MTGKDFFTLIEISEICSIDTDFIKELARFGIIEVYKSGNTECVGPDAIDVLKMVRRLYFDLGVNNEGIDIILSMRRQILDLQDEMSELKSKVSYFKHEQKYRNLEIIIDRGLLFDL
jgi:hypothetical protein